MGRWRVASENCANLSRHNENVIDTVPISVAVALTT